MTGALDDAVGEIKQRDRGLSAGHFLAAVAQAQMCGAQFWTGLDRRRADVAGEALSAVATPAATTAVELAQRFGPAQLAGITAPQVDHPRGLPVREDTACPLQVNRAPM